MRKKGVVKLPLLSWSPGLARSAIERCKEVEQESQQYPKYQKVLLGLDEWDFSKYS